jgi:predicted dehydrogenase
MRWNVGFIGFGFIGKVHALAYRSLPFYYDRVPGEFRFASVATSRPETARAAQETFGFERAVADWREIVDDPSIHIVHVAQPNVYHRDVLIAAMEAGKHIYCEKPLVAAWPEAQEVAMRLRRYTGVSQMCLQNRFFPATLKAFDLARDGLLGDILCFRGCYLHSGSVEASRVLNWKSTVEYGGGGVILDLGPHIIDLLQLLCGRCEAVFAHQRVALSDRKVRVGGKILPAATAEDHALMLMRLPGGAVGSVEVTKIATGTQDELRFEIHGTGGGLAFDLMKPGTLRVFEQSRPELGWQHMPTGGTYREKGTIPGKMAVGWVRGHVASLYNFASAVARNEPTRPDLRDGVQLQAVLEAAYRSAASGAWEDVPHADD